MSARSLPVLIIFALFMMTGTSFADDILTAPQALDMARQGQVTLVDIRTPQEWRQTGVAPGAKRVNMYNKAGLMAFLAELLAEVGDKEVPVALICRTGNRTTQAAEFLRAAGFKAVYNVKEGMAGSPAGPGWLRRGLPVEPCPSC